MFRVIRKRVFFSAMLLSVSFFWLSVFFECTTLCLLVFISCYLQITFPSVGPLLISFLKPSNPHLHLFNFNVSASPSSLCFSTFLLSSGLQVSCFLSLRNLFCLPVLFPLIYFLFPTRNAVDLIISSVLPFLHLAIHLLSLILFFYYSLCLHLFSLPFCLLGSKAPTWGRTICCQCLSFAYSSTLSFTHSQSHRFHILVSLSPSPSPCLYPSHNRLFLPLHLPSIFVPILSWEQVVEDDALL